MSNIKVEFDIVANIEGHDINLHITSTYVDNGIGGYEFWGAPGVHHDWGWEHEYSVHKPDPEDPLEDELEKWMEYAQTILDDTANKLLPRQTGPEEYPDDR